jgi:hypothetical protein
MTDYVKVTVPSEELGSAIRSVLRPQQSASSEGSETDESDSQQRRPVWGDIGQGARIPAAPTVDPSKAFRAYLRAILGGAERQAVAERAAELVGEAETRARWEGAK